MLTFYSGFKIDIWLQRIIPEACLHKFSIQILTNLTNLKWAGGSCNINIAWSTHPRNVQISRYKGMTNIWLHVQIYKVNKSVRIKTKMLQNRFSHWPQFYFFKEILKFKLCWAPIHFYMFGFQFYYCHEPGHQIDADLGCGLSSHQQPQSLESAVLEAGAGAELSWLSSRHCLPWGGSPPVSPPSSSWPLGRFWYREEYFVKYSEEKYVYVFKRNIREAFNKKKV